MRWTPMRPCHLPFHPNSWKACLLNPKKLPSNAKLDGGSIGLIWTPCCNISLVFQACRNGLLQHLERLLYYGAEKNAQNASGNTPLHVCAVNSQESCARSLLFRGANKEMLNYAGQTAFQTAVIANDAKLSELIQNHKSTDVSKYSRWNNSLGWEEGGFGFAADWDWKWVGYLIKGLP